MKFYSLDNEFIKKSRTIPDKFTGIIIYSNGTKKWCLNGFLHRIDGPAYEHSDGTKIWHLNGKYHREDGPAIEHPDGSKYWWLNGKQMTEEQHKLLVSMMKLKGLLQQ